MFGELILTIELTGLLSLFTGYKIDHNSMPPVGVKQTDWDTKTGIEFYFKVVGKKGPGQRTGPRHGLNQGKIRRQGPQSGSTS